MSPHGCGANHVDAKFFALVLSLSIQIVQDLHVIRHETDRHHHNVVYVGLLLQVAQVITNVRLKPRLAGRPGAALVDQLPREVADLFHDQPA